MNNSDGKHPDAKPRALSRRHFIRNAGVALLGLGGLIAAAPDTARFTVQTTGYGSSPYGGGKTS